MARSRRIIKVENRIIIRKINFQNMNLYKIITGLDQLQWVYLGFLL